MSSTAAPWSSRRTHRRAAFEREIDENRERLTRSDLDRFAKRRAKDRIAEIRTLLAKGGEKGEHTP